MTNRRHRPESALERVTCAMRDLPVPDGPDNEFQQRLLDRLTSSGQAPLTSELHIRHRRITMRHVFSIAASLLVVAAVIGWLASVSRTPAGSAFAQMLDQVINARTAVFTTYVEMRGQPQTQIKTMLLEPDWVREEIGEGEHRHVIVFNLQQRKSLTLSSATKKAQLRNITDVSPKQPKNVIEQIRDLRESSAEFLGEEKVQGKNTLKYRCDTAFGHFLLWFDPDKHFPVKAVMSESADDADGYLTITLTDFEWNVPLDDSLFTLDVPEGYELEQEVAKPSLDPESFVTVLRVYVRLNNGEFPEEFNALTLASIGELLDDPTLPEKERMAHRQSRLAWALDRPELEQMSDEQRQKEGEELAKLFAQGAVFLHVLLQTHDWHYLGKGVKLGEADKIVAWWRPKTEKANGDAEADDQADTATVLYGDLHIETKPVTELPASP